MNTIKRLEHEEAYNKGGMGEIARRFFHNLFSTNGTGDMEHILSGVERSIFQHTNLMLTVKYMEEEVYVALKDMSPTKALG